MSASVEAPARKDKRRNDLKERIFTKNFCFCFLSLFSISMVMYMLLATVTQYVTEFGATETVAGMVSGMYIVGGMFSRLASGKSMERFDWKKLALLAAGLHFAACCFYPFVRDLPLLVLVRFVHGVGFGMSSSAIATIGLSILPESRFGEAGGYFMMGTTLSVGVGPLAGGAIYDRFGASGCFTGAAVMSFLTGCFLLFVDLSGVEEAKPSPGGRAAAGDGKSGFSALLEPKAVPISVVTALTALGYIGVMSFYRLYAAQVGLEKAFSWFFLLYAGLLLFLRPMAGKIQDRFGDRWVCVPGILAQTAGLALVSLRPCVLTLAACALGCAMGYGSFLSAGNVIACQKSPPARRPYAVTTFYLCCDIAMGIGPALLGAVVTASGYSAMYVVSAGITLLALPLFLGADLAGKRGK